MRQKRTAQQSLFDPEPVHHPVADALEAISAWLDAHPELLDAIAADLGTAACGRAGLSCETVLRCAVLKHLRQGTWRSLEFTLRDSASARRFVRADPIRLPKKSALQATVGAVGPDTWERVNRCLLHTARHSGVETGARVRVDSALTETHILAPADSRLLYDGIRVLTRLLGQARQHLGSEAVTLHDHRRAAKRRYLEAGAQRGRERRAHTYRRLLRLARRTLGYVDGALCRRWRRRKPCGRNAGCAMCPTTPTCYAA
ncbi:MAG: transposase [Gammaproteobacteria bacterium]|nr:transposase [Gammaproteobacteria bacterium]